MSFSHLFYALAEHRFDLKRLEILNCIYIIAKIKINAYFS